MAHSYTNLLYHIVFATKDRHPWIETAVRPELWQYLGRLARSVDGIPLEVNGMPEHVHILARLRPSLAVADVIRTIKAKSSHWLKRQLRVPEFAWQTGYGAFTVSQSQVEIVRRYVQRQEEHHRTMPFMDEFRQLVRAHGLELDEQMMWD